MDITQSSYNEEIKSIATDLVEELMQEHDNDREMSEDMMHDRLHETIDGHQWVIYYAYNDDVLKYSENEEAYQGVYDNESLGQLVAERGINDLKTMMAYFAMYQDVSELLEEAFDTFEESLDLNIKEDLC